MRWQIKSIFVTDQEKALQFYTTILGFEKKSDLPAGSYRWLIVSTSEGSLEIELLLEPAASQIARDYQRANYEQGIPALSIMTNNLFSKYQKLKSAGVHFTLPPRQIERIATVAVFDDTCGNLIQFVEK